MNDIRVIFLSPLGERNMNEGGEEHERQIVETDRSAV
jgi:hypothetical protein